MSSPTVSGGSSRSWCRYLVLTTLQYRALKVAKAFGMLWSMPRMFFCDAHRFVMLQIGIHYTDVLEYLVGPIAAVSASRLVIR